jgi:HemY protein
MKVLFWVVALFALAVGLVIAARYNEGYALVVLPPWRVEIALNLLVILIVAAVILLYSILRLVGGAVQMPARVRQYRLSRQRDKAHEALLSAMQAYFEGRYVEAEQAALRSIALGARQRLATVIAARAAHALRVYDRRDRYLRDLAQTASDDDALSRATEASLLPAERRVQTPHGSRLDDPPVPVQFDRS